MPIIKSKKSKDNAVSIKAKINAEVSEQIVNYCRWAGIYDLGYFIEKAAGQLFKHDIEWNMHKTQTESPDEGIEFSILTPKTDDR